MLTRLSQPKPPLQLLLHRGRFLIAFVLVAALTTATPALFRLQPDSFSAVAFLSLPLVLFGALGVGREFLSPSLKELAFYSIAIVVAGLIWPGAQWAVSAYEAAGFVTLAAFMVLVFALALGLGVLSVKLLAKHDGDN